VLGREFSYELLQTASSIDAARLQQGLRQLVEVELLYQRGVQPQATYLFKHALIQDTAYHSLLKSTRQHYHQRIAQVLEERFRETKETQPELLAHHYTEAGLIAQAIPYWHQAGQSASQRSATSEAIAHLTKGLELLKTLPDTPERAQQELMLQVALSTPLMLTRGWAAPEVEPQKLNESTAARGSCAGRSGRLHNSSRYYTECGHSIVTMWRGVMSRVGSLSRRMIKIPEWLPCVACTTSCKSKKSSWLRVTKISEWRTA
jgi:predicted ATPase